MENKDKNLGNVDDLEVSALTDDELDSVAGGGDISTVASCMCCSTGKTIIQTTDETVQPQG
jgi:hypothetical protein